MIQPKQTLQSESVLVLSASDTNLANCKATATGLPNESSSAKDTNLIHYSAGSEPNAKSDSEPQAQYEHETSRTSVNTSALGVNAKQGDTAVSFTIEQPVVSHGFTQAFDIYPEPTPSHTNQYGAVEDTANDALNTAREVLAFLREWQDRRYLQRPVNTRELYSILVLNSVPLCYPTL